MVRVRTAKLQNKRNNKKSRKSSNQSKRARELFKDAHKAFKSCPSLLNSFKNYLPRGVLKERNYRKIIAMLKLDKRLGLSKDEIIKLLNQQLCTKQKGGALGRENSEGCHWGYPNSSNSESNSPSGAVTRRLNLADKVKVGAALLVLVFLLLLMAEDFRTRHIEL
tara:strand:+ start:779 stop:1273 length:495 start_codon:yes stop_codon:yes gene_type:complete